MKLFTHQKKSEPKSAGEGPALSEPTSDSSSEAPTGRLDLDRLARLERLVAEQSSSLDGIPNDIHRLEKSITRSWRELKELSGLLHHQADLTTEALSRAGWIDPEQAAEERALHKVLGAVATDKPVVVGPWKGEVGFELMYWIPFVAWLKKRAELRADQLTVVSRGGTAPWYRHITRQYVDILDMVSPDEFRERTTGKKKESDRRGDFDRELVEQVRVSRQLGDVEALHPALMYRLFSDLWRKDASANHIDSFTTFKPFEPVEPLEIAGVPDDYVVAKFYFSKCFPDSSENRAFVADLLARVSREIAVVLLSTDVRVDDHRDYGLSSGSGIFVVDPFTNPSTNLEHQSRLIRGARCFIGTYGGFSYLAPFYGVRSLSFFSDRSRFDSYHLDVAQRVFAKLTPGGFVVLDRRDLDVVQPSVDRWTRGPVS